jgi:hypothetical protein
MVHNVITQVGAAVLRNVVLIMAALIHPVSAEEMDRGPRIILKPVVACLKLTDFQMFYGVVDDPRAAAKLLADRGDACRVLSAGDEVEVLADIPPTAMVRLSGDHRLFYTASGMTKPKGP